MTGVSSDPAACKAIHAAISAMLRTVRKNTNPSRDTPYLVDSLLATALLLMSMGGASKEQIQTRVSAAMRVHEAAAEKLKEDRH